LRAALPAEIARCLSEYDLQHAREAIREGAKLFIVSVSFEIETFDENFRALSKLLGQSGEIITTVPGDAGAAEEISFRLLFAAEMVSNELVRRSGALGTVAVNEIRLAPAAGAGTAVDESQPARTALGGEHASLRLE